MSLRIKIIIILSVLLVTVILGTGDTVLAQGGEATGVSWGDALPWWGWILILFIFSFVLGILAILGGVGGGILFVPIVSSFFPFSLDFIRGAGLMVALSGAISASPNLLKAGLVKLRLVLPMALVASTTSILGAFVGLALPSNVVQAALGGTIILVVLLMAMARRSDYPEVKKPDKLSSLLRISDTYYEESLGQEVKWQIHRTPQGLGVFAVIGFIAGMFGIGAGWANVPTLNLLLGAPLKLSVASSVFLLSITDSTSAWVYINSGALLPLITIPSMAGMMLGTRIGARILVRTRPKAIRWIVITFLFIAGIRSLLAGLGIWR